MKTVIHVQVVVDTSPISVLRNGGGRRGLAQVEGLFESMLSEAFDG